MSSDPVSRMCFFLVAIVTLALEVSFAQVPFDTAATVKKVAPAVVEIRGRGEGGESAGSGFIISPDGKIVTSLHIIRDFTVGSVRLPNGEIFDSFSVLAVDERRDIAIIKIPGFELPSLELGNFSELQVGEPVLVIGNPHGLAGTVTVGVVSAIRDVGGYRVIQTDTAANPGNSGGPLVNALAQAVGIIGFKIEDSENLNFAVPINYASGLLSDGLTPMSLEEMRNNLSRSANLFASSRGAKSAKSSPMGKHSYLLLATRKTSTMQKELNEAAARGFRIVAGSPTSGTEMALLLERVAQPPDTYTYQLLATTRTGTMQKELTKAALDGFRLLPQTMIAKKGLFGGAEIVVVLERSPKSDILY